MNYFIDTNIIIDIFKNKITNEVKNIFKDKNSIFYINRLVKVECLRNISINNNSEYNKIKDILDNFIEIDIRPEDYNKAIKLSRYCRSNGVTLKGKCEAIDFIHFISIKSFKLESITIDNDFNKINNIYNVHKDEINNC